MFSARKAQQLIPERKGQKYWYDQSIERIEKDITDRASRGFNWAVTFMCGSNETMQRIVDDLIKLGYTVEERKSIGSGMIIVHWK